MVGRFREVLLIETRTKVSTLHQNTNSMQSETYLGICQSLKVWVQVELDAQAGTRQGDPSNEEYE